MQNLTAAYVCTCGHIREAHYINGSTKCVAKTRKGDRTKPLRLDDNHPLSPGKTIQVCICECYTPNISPEDWDAAEDAATYARENND